MNTEKVPTINNFFSLFKSVAFSGPAVWQALFYARTIVFHHNHWLSNCFRHDKGSQDAKAKKISGGLYIMPKATKKALRNRRAFFYEFVKINFCQYSSGH
jgi:hypothetical protein